MMTATAQSQQAVFVVDDDASVRSSLSNLFRSVGLRVEAFGSAAELLQGKLPEIASCLVLDIRLPGISGLDFQAELVQANIRLPVIFMTGHGDIPMSVRAMKAGAVDFLTKPFRDQDMLDAVAAAIDRDSQAPRQREGGHRYRRPLRPAQPAGARDHDARNVGADE
jgi:FixJ family two-component response regulator